MEYKIKMYCTQKQQLTLHYMPITHKLGNAINDAFLPDDTIHEIFILYKDKQIRKKDYKKGYCIKSIEIAFNQLLTEQEFILFITKMQCLGFYSGNDTKIQFIDKHNKILYQYSFQTIVKQTPKKRVYQRNTSTYRHITLHKKYSNTQAITCD
jgi:hypothetical protein